MKSFNQFLGEAEEKTPERQKLNLGVSPGQQSLPGMGKKKDKPAKPVTPAKGSEYLDPKTGRASEEGVRRYMNKRNTKGYFRTEGKPSAVTPEDVKAGLEKTKVDMQNPEEFKKVEDKINQKYGKPETVSVPAKPRKPADDAFAKKLELDTPQGAAAAQDAAKDMAADAKKGQTSLSGKPVPQVRLQRGQGSRPAGSTVARGGAPQLPNIPRGAARVTYGQGAAPTQSFAAFSQQATAMKPPASKATQQRVAQAATQRVQAAQPPTVQQQVTAAAKEVMKDVRDKKLESRTKTTRSLGKNVALPLAAGITGFSQAQKGQSEGESPATSAVRAVTVPTVSGAAATGVAKQFLKRKMPAWAVPAAAATYGVVEPAVSKGFSYIRNMIRGNK